MMLPKDVIIMIVSVCVIIIGLILSIIALPPSVSTIEMMGRVLPVLGNMGIVGSILYANYDKIFSRAYAA